MCKSSFSWSTLSFTKKNGRVSKPMSFMLNFGTETDWQNPLIVHWPFQFWGLTVIALMFIFCYKPAIGKWSSHISLRYSRPSLFLGNWNRQFCGRGKTESNTDCMPSAIQFSCFNIYKVWFRFLLSTFRITEVDKRERVDPDIPSQLVPCENG